MLGPALKMVVNWIYDTFGMKNELDFQTRKGEKFLKQVLLHSKVVFWCLSTPWQYYGMGEYTLQGVHLLHPSRRSR